MSDAQQPEPAPSDAAVAPDTAQQHSARPQTAPSRTAPPRSGSPFERTAVEELQSIRDSIDNIDAAVVHMLAERFKYTQRVGYLKATAGMPPSDPDRERIQIAKLRSLASESHLDPAFAEKFLNFIIAEVIHHHERIAGGDE